MLFLQVKEISYLFLLVIYLSNERCVLILNLELANRSILNCLELAAEKGEFINTKSNQRCLGKTKALIQFAKENGNIVLVNNHIFARALQKQYGYELIKGIDYTIEGIDGLGRIVFLRPIVFDEGCSPAHINELARNGHQIITGFMSEGPITD